MWPVAAAVSAGLALALKLRGDRLAEQCERTLDDLEATEDELDAVKEELKVLTAQVKAQESTIVEVRETSLTKCSLVHYTWLLHRRPTVRVANTFTPFSPHLVWIFFFFLIFSRSCKPAEALKK